jgi:hemerythrin-like domain-containing protein
MAIQIGARPDSGFDDPIGMLTDCHRRIEPFLRILCLVAEYAQGRALTGEEAEAVQAALQYFRLSGQRHTSDEEESLLPRLRAVSTTDHCTEIAVLENEHRRANDLHATVDTLFSAWIAAGALHEENEQQLLSETASLRLLYEGHIQAEEKIIFPRAAMMLDSLAIAAIGKELRARRK